MKERKVITGPLWVRDVAKKVRKLQNIRYQKRRESDSCV